MIYPNYVKQSPVLGLTSGAAGGASLSYFTHTVDAAPPGGGGADNLGSVSFDGDGDYLSLAGSNDFDFGSGDFTIEGFFYKTTTTSNQTLLCSSRYYTSGNNGNWILRITNAGSIAFATYDGTGNAEYTEFSASTSVSTWYHFALVRSGTGSNQTKFYLNGALAGSMTVSKSLSDAGTNGLLIGEESPNGPGNNFMSGYLSNIRIIKGTALYTSNFTPSTSPLTAVTNTKLLCCQSETSPTTAAVTPGTITANGNAAVSSFDPFGGGSVLFDGGGDCLTVADNADFEFGSGNFTIEAFINYTGNPGSGNSTYAIFSKWNNQDSNKGFILRITNVGSGEKLQFFYSSDGNSNNISTGNTTLSPGIWYHIAFVRNGSTGTFYINGAADSTTHSMGSNSIRNTTVPFRIGANLDGGAIDQEFKGLISNVRVIKGTALYTSNFTAPTSALTNVTNTKLLCCQSDTSPTAAAVTPGTITNIGSAVDSSSPFNAGGDSGSVQFDGVDDHLNITGQSDLAFGTSDFTLEFWVYFSSSDPTLDTIMETRSTTSGSDGFLIGRFHTSGYENKIALYTAGGYQMASNSGVSNSTWTHVAVVRSGSTTKLYIDGVVQSTTYSDYNNYSNGGLIIGENANNTYHLDGLISNFRMVKGTAVYTSDAVTPFAVPTAPLTNIPNTKLLCCNSTTSATSSTITPATIVNNGGATVSTSNPFNFGSVLFDQTSDYLSLSDSNDFNFGTGDFTIECFVKPETLNTSAYAQGFSTILDHDGGTGNYAGAWFAIHQNNNQIYWASNNANQINGGTLSLSWNHIAVVRSGSTTTLYVNGSSVANYTDNLNYTDSNTRGLYIGTQNGTARRFGGYISNLRLVKGTAVYSGNFTPPTSPLTAVTNTKLLCCQSAISATAAAVTPGTITNNGSTVDSSVPFALSGSVEFTGDPSEKDYLNVAKSSDFDFSGVFTLEAWAYFDTLGYDSSPTASGVDNNSRTKIKTIAESINWNAEIGQYHFGVSANNKFQFYIFDYPSSYENRYYQGDTTIQTGQWYHFMVNRDSSNNIRLYVNGTRQTVTKYINGSSQGSSSYWSESTALSNSNQPNPLRIGACKIGGTIYGMDGKISNLRMTAQHLYGSGSTITVPTSKLTTTSQSATASNVKLLCCQDLYSATNATKSPTSITANNTPTLSSSHPF